MFAHEEQRIKNEFDVGIVFYQLSHNRCQSFTVSAGKIKKFDDGNFGVFRPGIRRNGTVSHFFPMVKKFLVRIGCGRILCCGGILHICALIVACRCIVSGRAGIVRSVFKGIAACYRFCDKCRIIADIIFKDRRIVSQKSLYLIVYFFIADIGKAFDNIAEIFTFCQTLQNRLRIIFDIAGNCLVKLFLNFCLFLRAFAVQIKDTPRAQRRQYNDSQCFK